MNTYAEQAAFFDFEWPELRTALEQGGIPAASQLIASHADELERRVLYVFGAQAVTQRPWSGRSRDAQIAFAEAAMAEMLRQAETAGDEETRDRRVDGANVASFNLAADLALCFDDEGLPREQRHFERGLKAAQDCLAWRRQLNKGPVPFSLAYWASGIHRLALGDHSGAEQDFTAALNSAQQAAEEAGQPVAISPAAGFLILLNHGYLALARLAAGDDTAHPMLEEVLEVFRQQGQSTEDEVREDAAVGLDQLERTREWVAKRH